MSSRHPGSHELGQNFLVDRAVVDRVVALVRRSPGPIFEIGPGEGSLTLPLERLNRRITAVELDPRLADRLSARVGSRTTVRHGDALRVPVPAGTRVVVGNLPFHVTTAMLRSLLESARWSEAVLIVQWEVARRRAAVGGATLMTAEWWPWFEFALEQRVPARAFRPRPSVDGRLLTISRRSAPLVPPARRTAYRRFVRAVFGGRGRGLAAIVERLVAPEQRAIVVAWLAGEGLGRGALPRDLTAAQWATLFGLAVPVRGGTRPSRSEPGRDATPAPPRAPMRRARKQGRRP